MYQQPQQNPLAHNAAFIKGYFKKPIVLALAIVSAISVILAYSSATETTGSFFILLALAGVDSKSDLNDVMDSAADIQAVSVIISLIIPILTTVAFFIIYFKSNNADPSSNPSSGFSILSTISLIQLILVWITFVISGLLILIKLSEIQEINRKYLNSNSDISENIVVLIVFFILYAWVIIGYYTCQYNFYYSVKTGLTSTLLSNKGAGGFGVYHTLIAVFYILAAIAVLGAGSEVNETLSALTNGYAELDLMPALISFAIPISLSIMLATLANGYKAHIQSALYNQFTPDSQMPQQPVYAPQQYNQQPPYNPQPQYYQQPQYNENLYTPQPQYNNPPVAQAYTPQPEVNNNTPVYDFSDDEKTLAVDDYKSYATPQTPAKPAICPVCGNKLISEAPFCGHCGNKVK